MAAAENIPWNYSILQSCDSAQVRKKVDDLMDQIEKWTWNQMWELVHLFYRSTPFIQGRRLYGDF